MGDLAKTIIDIVFKAVDQAARTGVSLRNALAQSLEEAAAQIRSGALNVDDALARAKSDQAKIDALRERHGG